MENLFDSHSFVHFIIFWVAKSCPPAVAPTLQHIRIQYHQALNAGAENDDNTRENDIKKKKEHNGISSVHKISYHILFVLWMGGDRMWLHPSRKKQINCVALVAVYVYMSWLLPFVYLSTAKTTANITKQSRKKHINIVCSYIQICLWYYVLFISFLLLLFASNAIWIARKICSTTIWGCFVSLFLWFVWYRFVLACLPQRNAHANSSADCLCFLIAGFGRPNFSFRYCDI